MSSYHKIVKICPIHWITSSYEGNALAQLNFTRTQVQFLFQKRQKIQRFQRTTWKMCQRLKVLQVSESMVSKVPIFGLLHISRQNSHYIQQVSSPCKESLNKVDTKLMFYWFVSTNHQLSEFDIDNASQAKFLKYFLSSRCLLLITEKLALFSYKKLYIFHHFLYRVS